MAQYTNESIPSEKQLRKEQGPALRMGWPKRREAQTIGYKLRRDSGCHCHYKSHFSWMGVMICKNLQKEITNSLKSKV